jgi:hypothetical protein
MSSRQFDLIATTLVIVQLLSHKARLPEVARALDPTRVSSVP